MRGKQKDGKFAPKFSPLKWGGDFTEGNSWHYSWSVFHDPQGLIDLMGGKEVFVSMLDSVFSVPPVFDDSYYGQVIHEIREMTVGVHGIRAFPQHRPASDDICSPFQGVSRVSERPGIRSGGFDRQDRGSACRVLHSRASEAMGH